MNKKAILTLSLTSFLISSIGAPTPAHEDEEQTFGGKDVLTESPPRMTVSPDGQHAIGLKTQRVAMGALEQRLTATGQVQVAENRSVDITPRVSGTVNKVYVQQGSWVNAGQTLASIYSLEVANALTRLLEERARLQADLAKTRTQYQGDIAIEKNHVEVTHVTYQREQALLKEGITAKKDYLEAKHGYEDAVMRLNTLKKKAAQEAALLQRQLALTVGVVKSQLRVMGVPDIAVNQSLASNRVSSEIPVTSPVAGTVIFRNVTVGETLRPGQKIFSVVNLSPIWAVVNVFQEQLSHIRYGQVVRIQTPTHLVMTGTISSIGTVLDPVQKTLPVRIVSENPNGLLKPGMFVNADIVVGQSASNRLVVPASALIEENGRMVAYVKNGNDFQAVPVQTGQKNADQVEILDGLSEGDEVVTQGARQLRAQSLISASRQGTGKINKGLQTDQAQKTDSWPTLLIGMAIGAALMLGLRVVRAIFQKRPLARRR